MRAKRIILAIVFGVLLLPLINGQFNIIKSGGLKGAVALAINPDFTWKHWFSGKYQKEKEAYHNTNVSFYPDLIRLNNQIDFSLFGILHAKEVVEGQQHYLYETPYILSYTGIDKLPESTLLNNTLKIKAIHEKLQAKGKKFVFIIATNKADFYPEHLPTRYQKLDFKGRNYHSYLRYFDSLKINYIDFNKYFVLQKPKSKYPLITKFGTHWSSYGTSLVTDSIIRYLNVCHYDGKLIQPQISYLVSETYNNHDKEAFDPLNLIKGWNESEVTAIPQYKFSDKTDAVKPKMLCVSDSYFWEIYDQGVLEHVFSDLEFWYYNREHWDKQHKLIGDAAKVPNLGNNYLKKAEVVMMLASEFHLNCLTDDFLKKLD